MNFCPNCGEAVDEGDRFCQSCGTSLGEHGGGDGAPSGEPPSEATEPAGESGSDPATTAAAETEAAGTESTFYDGKRGVDFAFYFPKRGGWKAILISGLLVIGGIVLVPLIPLLGYTYRVGRAAALGHEEPPSYGDWEGLVVDGLRYLGVSILLGLLFVVAAFVVGAFAGLAGLTGAIDLLLIVVYAFGLYVPPAFLTVYFGSEDIGATFTDGRALELMRTGFYAKAVGWSVLLLIALSIISSLLIFVFPFAWAYALLSYVAFWGYVYYRAAEEGIVEPASGSIDGGD